MSLKLLSANHGAALAAILAARANRTGRGFCSGVYPITPSTECMEYLCLQEIEKGRVVKVESEHSAMGVCIGAASAGARTFTTTASNGLAYMAENCIAAACLRLPTMMNISRTAAPVRATITRGCAISARSRASKCNCRCTKCSILKENRSSSEHSLPASIQEFLMQNTNNSCISI